MNIFKKITKELGVDTPLDKIIKEKPKSLDMNKLKEVYPTLNLRDDNTLGYSEFKEALLKGGYKEKQ